MQNVAIVAARRTAMGGFQGALASLGAPELAAGAIRAAVADAGLSQTVDEALLGMVLPAGVGQAPARQAVLLAGLPITVAASTISKVCGSGMKAIIDGAVRIAAGEAQTALVGGMESMSNAPHLIPNSRTGQRLGHGRLVDHMFHDGLEDAYGRGAERGALMGVFAEICADKFGFSREAQDEYALRSLNRALVAQAEGGFATEIAPLSLANRHSSSLVTEDEPPKLVRLDKIPLLKPAFRANGTVTAASSSSISDGAAALVLASRAVVDAEALRPRAWIVGSASHAQEPAWFSTAPVAASQKLLARLGWQARDVDLWEVNEAFAVVAMAFLHEMALSANVVNVNGGACALGHPIGASGARIVVTLLHALEARDLRRGIACICIGGGEALAIAIERQS